MTYAFDRDTHIHRLAGRIIPGSSDILKDAGFTYPSANPEAMDRGRAVHSATELDDKGILDESSVTDDIFGYLLGWRKFRQETGFKPIRIEEPNCHPTLGFAAQLDREGTWNRSKAHVLVEIKKYAPMYFVELQLAAQDLSLPALSLPRDWIVCELKATGDYAIHEFNQNRSAARAMFISLVSLYHYKHNH